MKKFILISFVLFGFILFSNKDYYISDNDSIRFRVIANSNSFKDLMIKELIVKELSFYLSESSDLNSTRKNIMDNMNDIENKISEVFQKNNYDKVFNIMYGMNEFPKKEYNGIVYEEGLYESLVIEIGEAKGDNYWCFLYPSLCFIDEKNDAKYKSKIIEFISDMLM